MCGICGFHRLRDSFESGSKLNVMVASLSHRGPDGHGSWLSRDGKTGLGNTRLAIIDISGGRQPLVSEDEKLVIVFNGEIYNFSSLRSELVKCGHRFVTRSDTEVVLAAYRQWGRECLNRFHGMFALAIYEVDLQTLFLARDRTGIKPLYFYDGPNGFYFASELKAILSEPAIPRRVEYQALADFMMLSYPIGPKTPFSELHELEPGTWLQVTPTEISRGRYWSWSRSPVECDPEEAMTYAANAIRESLHEHLVSDTAVGAFLSGGIDSSLLLALLVRDLGQDIEAFTLAFDESAYDESPYAIEVARFLGVRHRVIRLKHSQADIDLVNKLHDQFDLPYGDSSAIPTYLVCKEIRNHVKVAISGDGGDEMFGGYSRFWHADMAKRIGNLPNSGLAAIQTGTQVLKRFSPDLYRKSRRFLRSAISRGDGRFLALSCYLFPEELSEVFSADFVRELAGYMPSLSANGNGSSDLGGAEFVDATVRKVLPGDYLRKVDMMSSAVGLEVRVPFLGESVMECAKKIPARLQYAWGRNKRILRSLAERYLPKKVVEKPKAGFGIPLDSWLGRDGCEEIRALLTSPAARIRTLIRPEHVASLFTGFSDGVWEGTKRSRFNTYQQVYFLWSLERWLTRWNPAF